MKQRRQRCVFMSRRNHDLDQGLDFIIVDAGGKTAVLVEGKPEQALLYALGARSVFLTAGALGPFSPDPPHFAGLLVSLIPLKHRVNLPSALEQDYRNRLIPKHGLRKARVLYWIQVIYALLEFLARPLAGIVGIGWIAKLIDILIRKIMR